MPSPILLLPGLVQSFPPVEHYDAEGLIAVGGDLSAERLLLAYRCGVFPWYDESGPLLWWCPDPRAIFTAGPPHLSRSMRRVINTGAFTATWNKDFSGVMKACSQEREDGTWITAEIRAAYFKLHSLGAAHSLEIWSEGQLVGGVYGVQVGGLFAAESMFHRVDNASKLAILMLRTSLSSAGVQLIDVQFLTPHLKSLGAQEVSRSDYLRRIRTAQKQDCDLITLDLTSPV